MAGRIERCHDPNLFSPKSNQNAQNAVLACLAQIGPALFVAFFLIVIGFQRIAEKRLLSFLRGYIVLGNVADVGAVPIEE